MANQLTDITVNSQSFARLVTHKMITFQMGSTQTWIEAGYRHKRSLLAGFS